MRGALAALEITDLEAAAHLEVGLPAVDIPAVSVVLSAAVPTVVAVSVAAPEGAALVVVPVAAASSVAPEAAVVAVEGASADVASSSKF